MYMKLFPNQPPRQPTLAMTPEPPFSSYEPYQPAHDHYQPAPCLSYDPYQPAPCLSYVPYEPASRSAAPEPTSPRSRTTTESLSLPVHQIISLSRASYSTPSESLSLVATQMLSLTALSVHGHLLDTQIKLQIDLADIMTLVSGHLLDTQIKLQIDLAVSFAPTEASVLTPCLSLKINSQKFISPANLNMLALNVLSPLTLQTDALAKQSVLEIITLASSQLQQPIDRPLLLQQIKVNTLPPLLPLEINSLPLHPLEINSLPLLPTDNYSLCFKPPPSCPFEGVCGSQLDSPSPPQHFYMQAALSASARTGSQPA
ncbi:hypothetical protein T492DRAFT_876686, partial [Pavlovales sp. CCMP2436]